MKYTQGLAGFKRSNMEAHLLCTNYSHFLYRHIFNYRRCILLLSEEKSFPMETKVLDIVITRCSQQQRFHLSVSDFLPTSLSPFPLPPHRAKVNPDYERCLTGAE